MRTQDAAGVWHSTVDPAAALHPALLHDHSLSDGATFGPFEAKGGPLCPGCEGHDGEEPEYHMAEHGAAPDHGTDREYPVRTDLEPDADA